METIEKNEKLVFECHKRLGTEDVKKAMRIHTTLRKSIGEILRSKGFLEIPPVIFSPITDPLNHPVYDPSFTYLEDKYALTKSMIFHKQIAVKHLEKIFIFSPNVRLETSDKRLTGRHLLEFTQVDVEAKEYSREQMMEIQEEIIIKVIEDVKRENPDELKYFGRELPKFQRPFKRIRYGEAREKYGEEFEKILSEQAREPFWIIDIPLKEREFYDLEKKDEPGVLMDMDLIYPEGYGEASSGGEREYNIDRILERIRLKDQKPEQFSFFIEFAKLGIEPSAGFGIGIERLLRYVCGVKNVKEILPFPKVPGEISI
ncbi:asparagine synthetase A [Caldiplasma sukawensis]